MAFEHNNVYIETNSIPQLLNITLYNMTATSHWIWLRTNFTSNIHALHDAVNGAVNDFMAKNINVE